ncbi:MAG: class I SAM-dependent methyltransferase [Chloroflexi bacterium]|nr:class I SAM-dependent methyltransferase [Chloroflexota bacterium]
MGQNNTQFAEKYISDLEEVGCNACGSLETDTLAERERFGLPLRTVICKNCGLIFINPRPTKEMYAEFYKSDYRKTVSGSDEGDENQFQREYTFAAKVSLPIFKKYLPNWSPRTIMELGSSYGGILSAHMDYFPGCKGFGIEPLLKIGEFARRRTGATIFTTLLEDFQSDKQYDLVILSRTLNHTLDPVGNLKKIRSMLSKEGIFVLILQDPVSHTIHMPLESVTEMTHPYMFTRESIQYLLRLCGMEIVGYQDEYIDGRQMNRRDYRKLQFSYMVILSRLEQEGMADHQKPDYLDIKARIQANQAVFRKYGAYIERWRNPSVLMRLHRKVLNVMGKW